MTPLSMKRKRSSLLLNWKDGDFEASEPQKGSRKIYAYEQSTAVNLDSISATALQKLSVNGLGSVLNCVVGGRYHYNR